MKSPISVRSKSLLALLLCAVACEREGVTGSPSSNAGPWGTPCPTTWSEDPDGDAPQASVPCTGNRRCSIEDGEFEQGCAPYWSLSCNGSYWESQYAHCDGAGDPPDSSSTPEDCPTDEDGPFPECIGYGPTCYFNAPDHPDFPGCHLVTVYRCQAGEWVSPGTPEPYEDDPDCFPENDYPEAGVTDFLDASDASDAADALSDAMTDADSGD